MKPVPPRHVILPVLTERLQPADVRVEQDDAVPFEVQSSAYANAVYRGPEHPQSLAGDMADAPGFDLDQLWAQIAPGLQQQVLEQVQAEFDALAPQFAARLFQSLEPSLCAALAEALKRQ